MKKINYLALASIAALAMGSCSNDDMGLVGGSNELRVNGTINEIKTRANDTDFEDGDVIGILGTGIENVGYAYNGAAFAPQSSAVKVVETTSVSAYSPYTSDLGTGEITFDVATDENIDFLFAQAVQVTPENPTANFVFSHKMSKLKVTVVDADNQFTDQTLTLTLGNVATTGKFNTATGLVTPNAANGTLTSAIQSGVAKSFIVPSSPEENKTAIVATVGVSNGDFYVANITPALAAGTQYNVSLTIKKNNPDLNVGGSITDWEQNEMGDIDMGKGEKPYTLAVGDYLLKDGKTVEGTAENASAYSGQIAGVVYFVGNPQPSALYASKYNATQDILAAEAPAAIHGLAIALKDANDGTATRLSTNTYNFTGWFDSSSDASKYIKTNIACTSISEDMLGYNNTAVYKAATTELTNDVTFMQPFLDLLAAYNTSNAIENASDWYLPSYAEFQAILKNYDLIKTSIDNAQGSLEQLVGFPETTNGNFYWTSDTRNASSNWATSLNSLEEGTLYVERRSNGKAGFVRFAIAF